MNNNTQLIDQTDADIATVDAELAKVVEAEAELQARRLELQAKRDHLEFTRSYIRANLKSSMVISSSTNGVRKQRVKGVVVGGGTVEKIRNVAHQARAEGRPKLTKAQIVAEIRKFEPGINPNTVQSTLSRMVKDGLGLAMEKTPEGAYLYSLTD